MFKITLLHFLHGKHSERFDTGLKTIKMYDNLDFSIIIEQQF